MLELIGVTFGLNLIMALIGWATPWVPTWVWVMLIVMLLVLLVLAIGPVWLALWLMRGPGGEAKEQVEPRVQLPARSGPPIEMPSPEPDDLKAIEGIGPKISSVLAEAGILTFAQVAATSVDRLQAILDEAGIRIANPATWPEQAGLAAVGDWAGLERLQGELKGGRRV